MDLEKIRFNKSGNKKASYSAMLKPENKQWMMKKRIDLDKLIEELRKEESA